MLAAGAAQVNASPHGHNCARRYLWVWISRTVTLKDVPRRFIFLLLLTAMLFTMGWAWVCAV